jgi:hypothetical protein
MGLKTVTLLVTYILKSMTASVDFELSLETNHGPQTGQWSKRSPSSALFRCHSFSEAHETALQSCLVSHSMTIVQISRTNRMSSLSSGQISSVSYIASAQLLTTSKFNQNILQQAPNNQRTEHVQIQFPRKEIPYFLCQPPREGSKMPTRFQLYYRMPEHGTHWHMFCQASLTTA